MKKLLAFALTAGLSISLFAADIFKYAPITGKVKAYTETEFSIASRFGTLYRTPSTKVMHVFDSTGKETTSSELTPKDAVINTISSTYDSAGNLSEQLCTSNDGEVIWKNTFTYKNGLKADVSEYDKKGSLRARTIYTYENNLLTDESSYDGEGALIWKTIYKYSDTGRLASVNEYNPDGSFSFLRLSYIHQALLPQAAFLWQILFLPESCHLYCKRAQPRVQALHRSHQEVP